ncbi:MAG: LamB/YcsF family protein [Polyangiaceae bacterium]
MTAFLNIDLGELFDEPEALYAKAHVANVACGGHAGDATTMRRAVELCRAHGARLGAHPSYPDRAGFGRHELDMAATVVEAHVKAQCAELAAAASACGERVVFVKAHGALYHASNRDLAVAEALVRGAKDSVGSAFTLIGPPGGAVAAAAKAANLRFAREAFADRATRADGSLVPRSEPDALLLEEAAVVARARALAMRCDVDTLCVHGDTPHAVELASAVRRLLDCIGRASLPG